MAGENIVVILGVGAGIAFVWLAVREAVATFEGEHPPLPPLSIYGDFPWLPEEAKVAGGEDGFAGGRDGTEPTARRNANNDIAHRERGL